MASATHKNDHDDEREVERTPKTKRVLQVIGAVIVTGFALWFLFGVPVYVLFGAFFD